jgi:hypothetical protein
MTTTASSPDFDSDAMRRLRDDLALALRAAARRCWPSRPGGPGFPSTRRSPGACARPPREPSA